MTLQLQTQVQKPSQILKNAKCIQMRNGFESDDGKAYCALGYLLKHYYGEVPEGISTLGPALGKLTQEHLGGNQSIPSNIMRANDWHGWSFNQIGDYLESKGY